MTEILEKSGNFMRGKKWEPCCYFLRQYFHNCWRFDSSVFLAWDRDLHPIPQPNTSWDRSGVVSLLMPALQSFRGVGGGLPQTGQGLPHQTGRRVYLPVPHTGREVPLSRIGLTPLERTEGSTLSPLPDRTRRDVWRVRYDCDVHTGLSRYKTL